MKDLMFRRVRLRGNSFVLTIPMPMAREIGIVDDEYLYCARINDKILVGRGRFHESASKEIDEPDKYDRALAEMMKNTDMDAVPPPGNEGGQPPRRADKGAGRPATGTDHGSAAVSRPRSKLERLQFK